jgi:hypothetical protein
MGLSNQKPGGEGRNRSPQASFLMQKCLILLMSQALLHHYLTQHLSNTFADVFAECDMKLFKQLFVMDTS